MTSRDDGLHGHQIDIVPGLATLEACLLWAELCDHEHVWNALVADLRQQTIPFDVTPMAFALLAQRRFSGVRDLREVTQFVTWYNSLAPPSERVVVRQAEAVLRGPLGETYLIAALDRGVFRDISYRMLFALVDEMRMSDEEISGLLFAAEQTVREALDAGVPELTESDTDFPVRLPAHDDRTYWRPRYSNDFTWGSFPVSRDMREGATFKRKPRKESGRQGARESPQTIAGQFWRAAMLRRSDERERMLAELKRTGSVDANDYARTLFAIVMRRRFAPSAGLREITEFVQIIREAFGEHVPVLESESLIRRALGEDVDVSDIGIWTEMVTYSFGLMGSADLIERDEREIDAWLVKAEAEVRQKGFNPTLVE